MFKFLFARHRKAYIKVGWQYKTNPERVYKLAHGSRAKNNKEKQILHELLALDIFHRHHSSNF